MQITFSPIRSDQTLSLSRRGDTLIVNGEEFDFSGVPDGAVLPNMAVACDWLVSDVERIGGVLHLSLMLPHGPDAPKKSLFPENLMASDGEIVLPPNHKETGQ